MKKYKKLQGVARKYLRARRAFRLATDHELALGGNDNLVGRIGEFIAVQFLQSKLRRKRVDRNRSPVIGGYDIVADKKRVSVKIITSENKSGRTTPIRNPWDELILIELGNDIDVARIGYLTRAGFERALKNGQNAHTVAKRTMLNEHGLFGKYGKVYTSRAVKGFL